MITSPLTTNLTRSLTHPSSATYLLVTELESSSQHLSEDDVIVMVDDWQLRYASARVLQGSNVMFLYTLLMESKFD